MIEIIWIVIACTPKENKVAILTNMFAAMLVNGRRLTVGGTSRNTLEDVVFLFHVCFTEDHFARVFALHSFL